MAGGKDHKLSILVHGIERFGYQLPKPIEGKTWKLVFEPFETDRPYHEFDGIIVFNRTFEKVEVSRGYMDEGNVSVRCYRQDLARRQNQYNLLLEQGGFGCFALVSPFVDHDSEGNSTADTDLAKSRLNYESLGRDTFERPVVNLRIVQNEFTRFLKERGAAVNWFWTNSDRMKAVLRHICYGGGKLAGFAIGDAEFFIPCLPPKKHEVHKFFEELVEPVVSVWKKSVVAIPSWANDYAFEGEKRLLTERADLTGRLRELDKGLERYGLYKRVLCLDGQPLVEAVTFLVREGLDLRVTEPDGYIEDRTVVDENDKPLVLIEIKGTNGGIKREYINQADSHRERRYLPEDFPSVVIVNAHIKDATKLDEKDHAVPPEQVKHAVKQGVLVLRALDLLNLAYLREVGKLDSATILSLLTTGKGWLKVTRDGHEVVKE